jgi:hypothetical protein
MIRWCVIDIEKRFARTAICFPVASFLAILNIAIRFNSPIDNASVATLPLGIRGNLTTEAACRRFGSLTGFDD